MIPLSIRGTALLNLFLYTSIILPAGSAFGVNFKFITLALLLGSLLLLRDGTILVRMAMFLLPIIILLISELIYTLLIHTYDYSLALLQSKDIFVFFMMFCVCTAFSKENKLYQNIINAVNNSMVIVGLLKLVIILYAFVKGMTVSSVINTLSIIFNVDLMTFDIADTSLARINFPSDSILIISIFYMATKIFREGLTKKDIIIIGIMLFSALITMSRFQWASTGVALMLAITMNMRKKKSIVILLSLMLMVLGAASTQSVQDIVSARFDEKTVNASDGVRDIQQKKIIEHIENAPYLGNGIGYYIPDFVRSSITKYAYELQIPALIMQIGFIGTGVVILMTLAPLIYSARQMSIVDFSCYMAIVVIWLLAAFFNPSLFSSSGGAAMAALYSLAQLPVMQSKYKRVSFLHSV